MFLGRGNAAKLSKLSNTTFQRLKTFITVLKMNSTALSEQIKLH